MDEKGSTNNLEHLASKLSDELEELEKINGSSDQVKKAIIIKDQLLREIREFLSKKNRESNNF